MNSTGILYPYLLRTMLLLSVCLSGLALPGWVSAAANDYCIKPPFVSQSAPPMVMFEVGRDHKLYYEAYNDGVDLNGDGRIERTYDHSIEYYGYFNPYKCYTPASGSSANDYFTPVATNTDRFCSSGQWGGNILNWLSMSRMDVLRKVMYGGQRSQESPRILLDRAYIPQDAHSWGKEYTGKLCYNSTSSVYKNMCYEDADCDSGYTCTDKSVNLLGMVKPVGGGVCSGFTITWGTASQGEKKLLVARYPNASASTGNDHTAIINAFDSSQFYSGFSPQYVTDFSDTILDPAVNHGSNYAQIIVSEFQVGNNENGTWSFAIDGDDGVELEVRDTSGTVINPVTTTATSPYVAYYGAHGAIGNQTKYGTYSLAENTWYRMIVRHAEAGGEDGVKVWYKKPGASSWTIYGYKKNTLTVRAPDIVVGNNDCTLKNSTFITTGVPYNSGIATNPPTRHLICNTTLSAPSTDTATSILRLIKDSNHRIWEWASKERPVCDDTFTDGSSATANRTDYTVQTEVCKAGVGTLSMDDRFERCRSYGGTFNASTRSYSGGSYVPVGLFQKYGEVEFDESGNAIKVCSKTMGKVCNGDNDCGAGEGLCFTKAPMYFGLITSSYTKNTSGGVLRKNPGPVFDEVVDTNGKMQTSENERGNLINSINRLKIIDFDYGSHSYSNCGWITNRPMGEGECKMWGNPIAEMMYESLRYFAGKGTTSGGGQTAEFDYSTTADSGVSLSKPKWGYNKGSTYYKPFEIFPSCSQPFMLLLSDVNTSFDSDQIPGSLYAKPDGSFFTEDAASPQLGLGVVTGGKSLLNQLTDFIGQVEGINGNSWFIGESSGTTDFICSAKTVANLSAARGICTEEPTKKGSYYAAALAYYGKNQFKEKTGKSAMSTFVVAMSSPFADIKVKAGSGFVNVVPVGKSVYGGGVDKCLGYSTCTLTTDADGNNRITSCPTDAFCPTNSLVDFYIDDVRYDNSNDIIYAKFRINFEDVEQGADHDMDAIASYELCTQAAATAHYGSCTGTIAGLQVKLKSEYAAGGISQLLGFVISGTTADGTYLVIKDVDTGSGAISGLPVEWSKTYTVSAGGSAGYLKNPLWYAAKWGGFVGAGYPSSTAQWDKNNDGLPDTYFPVSNPLQLDEQLEQALIAILARTSSGTAASIVNNSGEAGTNMLQAVFYPLKEFGNASVSWIGEMQNMWFYLDPYLNANAIREDTVSDKILDMQDDYITTITFDASQGKTFANRFTNKGVAVDQIELDNLSPLWRAGELLYLRSSARTLKTSINGTSLLTGGFADANKTTLRPYLQAATDAEATKIINWVHGTDTTSDPTIRSRSVSYKGNPVAPWRLGDIISSTPKVQPASPMQGYDIDYNDLTYKTFWSSNDYKSRGMVYVGANDGMLHAFKLGTITRVSDSSHPTQVARLTPDTAPPLGQEEWAYIPQNVLPYLKYLMQPDYGHLYTVDATSRIIDVSINSPTGCSGNYWDCERKTTLDTTNIDPLHKADLIHDATSWRTVLLGGMGLGGSSRPSGGACAVASDCVKAPIASLPNVGLSSYFALDVSVPSTPSLMWEFTNPALGYTLTPPAVVRINGKKSTTDSTPDKSKNGRWFAVFGSGPTGPINTVTHQFYGKSDQTLKLFIVDLKTGTLLQTIDTGIAQAFAGSLTSNSALDTDFWDANSIGYYSHDVVYIGYTKFDSANNRWDGGVLRLVTNENANPETTPWTWSKVIEGIGPVTTAISALQDRTDKRLWLYFGGGRYFYKDSTGIDDADADPADPEVRRYIYGIKEPCYPKGSGMTAKNAFDATCSAAVSVGSLDDQSDGASPTLSSGAAGWKIKLSKTNGNYKSERLLTNPSASYNGNVTFTTFMPTADICGYGGQTFVWNVRGLTGSAPLPSSLKGKLILQLSTGAFETVDLRNALTGREGRRTGLGNSSNDVPTGGYTGGTSKDTPPEQKPPKGVPRILQIRER